MDQIGLDTVALIESHYIAERSLDPKPRDFLVSQYINNGKLGNKSEHGGLYPKAAEIQPNHPRGYIYFLDVGTGCSHDPWSSGRVLRANSDGKDLRTLISGQKLPDGIVIDHAGRRIYWTCMGSVGACDGQVNSCDLEGQDLLTIVPSGKVHTPKQISIDHKSRKLYFCDREGLRVMRCNMDGSALETVIQTGDWKHESHQADRMRWCVGVAVDSIHEKLYWTQKGSSKSGTGRIFRANLHVPPHETVKNRTDIELLFDKLPEPIDLEIDSETESLYWTDRGEIPYGNTINVASVGSYKIPFSAMTPQEKPLGYQILAHGLHEPIGLKLDMANRHIYAADLGGTVYRFNLDGSGKEKLHEHQSAFSGITFMLN
jgi:hypothetical protein